MNYIESGKSAGAKVVTGGGRIGNEGYFIQPTIFTNVKPDMKIVQEEIFGPVGVVIKFKTEEEVTKLANATTYGLSSTVFTKDIDRALRLAAKLEAGNVHVRPRFPLTLVGTNFRSPQINQMAIPDFRVSFGGVKQSGFGKEMGEYALEAFTTVKSVQVNIGAKI